MRGIERGVGVLEDDLHAAAQGAQFAGGCMEAAAAPSKKISPEVGSMRRSSMRATVLLPEPDSPTRPRVSPG